MLALLLVSGCTSQTTEQRQGNGTAAGQTVLFSLKVSGLDGRVLLEKSGQFEKGTNCLEAMKKLADVGAKEYSFGAMVESINDIKPAKDEFLKLFVNSLESQVGISLCKADQDTQVEWKIDKIEGYTA